MNNNTIQEQWESYKAQVIPKGATDGQIRETKKAFYAGVNAILYLQMTMPKTLSEDAEVAMMEGWVDEISQFVQEVTNGKHR